MKLHQLSQTDTGRLEFNCELPGTGGTVWSFPNDKSGPSASGVDGPVFKVSSKKPWLGSVAGSGLFAFEWLDSPVFAVVTDRCGVLIDYDDPKTFNEMGYSDFTCGWVVSPDGVYVLSYDFIRLQCYNKEGPQWETSRLVLDDLKVDRISSTMVHVSGDHSPLGICERVRLKLNLKTGEIVSGETFNW